MHASGKMDHDELVTDVKGSSGLSSVGSPRLVLQPRRSKWRWNVVIPYVFCVSVVLVLFGFLPWGIYELHTHDQETHVEAWFVAGVFVCLAIPITIWDIAQHLRHWCNPVLQKFIIRILWMVPVYALDSFFALRFVDSYIYLDATRECYEAYVIYNFYTYLLTFLKLQPGYSPTEPKGIPQKHLFPVCCLPQWQHGQQFIDRCTHGVTSYVVVRPILTFVAVICQVTGTYDEGEWSLKRGYIYVAVINSISQFWAMYCLVLFYFAFKQELKPIKPVAKFLVIKAVVFFSFWQSVLIAILTSRGVIKEDERWTTYNKATVSSGIQDFLICIEMFIAAIVHNRVFSFREHLPEGDFEKKHRLGFVQSVKHLFDVSDVRDTVVDHLQVVSTLGGRFGRQPQFRETSSLRAPLVTTGGNYGTGNPDPPMTDV